VLLDQVCGGMKTQLMISLTQVGLNDPKEKLSGRRVGQPEQDPWPRTTWDRWDEDHTRLGWISRGRQPWLAWIRRKGSFLKKYSSPPHWMHCTNHVRRI